MANKIKKLINDTNKIENKISITDNQVTNLFKQDNQLLSDKLIYESSITDAIFNTINTYSVIKDIVVPASTINISDWIDLELPRHLIPFIDTDIIYQTIPNTEIKGGNVVENFSWNADYVEIKGDGNMIFYGSPLTVYEHRIYTEDELEIYSIPINHTKNAFKGNIYYNKDGYDWRALACEIRTVYYGETFPTKVEGEVSHIDYSISTDASFTNIYTINESTNGIYGKWRKNTWVWHNLGWSPDLWDYIWEEVFLETTFVDATYTPTSFTFYGSLYKYVGSSWVFQYKNSITPFNTVVTLEDFEQVGYYAYWSTNTQAQIVITRGIADGNYFAYRLMTNDLPHTETFYTYTLDRPYTSITFKRNQGDFPEIEDLTVSKTLYSPLHPTKELTIKHDEDPTKNSKILLYVNFQALLLAPATVEKIWEVPEYNDIYTQYLTGYTLTTETHSLKERYTYSALINPVKYQIKVYLKNPFYYQERRKLEK